MANRFTKDSIFSKAVDQHIEDASSLLNALDFVESPQGLSVELFPVQRVIIRCMFGVPFDYRPIEEYGHKWKSVPMHDPFKANPPRLVSEAEFLHICYEEGRCNIGDWRDIPEWGVHEGVIFAGRRGGKSQLVSAIGAYALYRLLNIRSPQEFFGLIPGSHIDFTFLAQDEDGSNRLFSKLKEDVNRSPFFAPYLQKDLGNSEICFITESDRGKRSVTPTIRVASWPCTTNAVRGPSSVFLALDEFAHFRSNKGSTSDEVYSAATPATGTFHHMITLPDGEQKEILDALTLSISSPWTKTGKMYDLFKSGIEEGLVASNRFVLRVSTAEMNPTIPQQVLMDEYKKNNLTWKAEFGGNFLESSESYVSEASIKACTDVQWTEMGEPIKESGRANLVRFHPSTIGRQYFWAIDLGMVNDATAVAISHLEFTGGNQGITLVYDYIDRMMVGEKFDGPGVPMGLGEEKYINYKALPLEDLLMWLRELNEIMPCFRGGTDQHGGQQLIQLLELNQIHNIELINLTTSLNSQMAFALRGYIVDTRCRFPYVPKFMSELRLVEAEFVNKHQIRVQAPMEKGSHDDMVDAVELNAYLAQRWLQEEGHLFTDPTGISLAIQEQMYKPTQPIINMDGVSLQELQFMSRYRKIQQDMGMGTFDVVRNPYKRR